MYFKCNIQKYIFHEHFFSENPIKHNSALLEKKRVKNESEKLIFRTQSNGVVFNMFERGQKVFATRCIPVVAKTPHQLETRRDGHFQQIGDLCPSCDKAMLKRHIRSRSMGASQLPVPAS